MKVELLALVLATVAQTVTTKKPAVGCCAQFEKVCVKATPPGSAQRPPVVR